MYSIELDETRHLKPNTRQLPRVFKNAFWSKHAVKAGKHSSASLRPSSKCFFLHSKIFGEVLPFKIGNVKLPKATLVVHVADLSKYFSLFPALVVGPANRPHAAYKWETAGGAETHNQILSGYQRFNSISTRINIFYIYIFFKTGASCPCPHRQSHLGPGRRAHSDHSGREPLKALPQEKWSTPESSWPSTSSGNHASSPRTPSGTEGTQQQTNEIENLNLNKRVYILASGNRHRVSG